MSNVKITMRPNWQSQLLNGMKAGLYEEMLDIDTRSVALAPKLTGALVNSRRLRLTGPLEYTLSYGDSRVPYALRRHYENKKHPSTKLYLSNAAETITRGDQGKYYRGKV